MNDKDRELVEQVLHTAGTAGQAGFGYMVRYQVAEGSTSVLVSGVLLAVIAYGFKRLMQWDAQDEAALVKGVAMLALAIGTIVFACCLQSGLAAMFAPEGAAIHSVIGL